MKRLSKKSDREQNGRAAWPGAEDPRQRTQGLWLWPPTIVGGRSRGDGKLRCVFWCCPGGNDLKRPFFGVWFLACAGSRSPSSYL